MRRVLIAAAVVVATSPIGFTHQKSPSEVAFERLKGLVGTWEAVEKAKSRSFTAEYTLTGGDHVLVEEVGGMMTTYHLDNGALRLTHFCGAGNQPRMRVKAVDHGARRIQFEMYDITNLKSRDAYRSTSLDIRFLDDGTVELTYGGWSASGSSSQTFHLLRRTAPPRTR